MGSATTFVLLAVLLGCVSPLLGASSWTFSYTGSIQLWQVPSNVIRLKITAVGGSGGIHLATQSNANLYRGAGINAQATFYVQPGTTLQIIVGSQGGTSAYCWYCSEGGGGGGGGSFVFNAANPTYPMLAGGGGGGGSIEDYAIADPFYDFASGIDAVGNQNGANNWFGNGGATAGNSAIFPGGKGWNDIKNNQNVQAGSGSYYGTGGYPGGGSSKSLGALAGGGSGYSGGAGGVVNYPAGAGGGSYSAGSNTAFSRAQYFGNGYVTIEVAPSCDDNSDFDAMNQTCLCRSGYSGLGCQAPPGDCVGNIPRLNVTYPYPTIDTASDSLNTPQIREDNLVLQLVGPFVNTRRYTTINFQGATPTSSCNFAGQYSYWTKTFDSADTCRDILTLKMPWAKHSQCGFAPYDAGDASVNVYKSKILMTFSETMGVSYGVPLVRTTTHSYDVFVYFPNSLTVTLNNTNVVATVQLDVVLTKQSYDSTNQALVLEFTTVTPWSGRMSTAMDAVGPAGINVFQAPTEITVPATTCTSTSGSACAQQFRVSFQLAQNQSLCNFDGRYTLNSTIFACRTGMDCSTAPVTVTFQLQSGRVCANVAVRPTIRGTLKAFPSVDAFGSDPISNFKLGDRVYFVVATDASDKNNHVNTTFQQITYYNSIDGTVELYNINGLSNGGISDAGKNANLFISNVNKYFYMYFSGEQFQIPFGTKVAFTFTAKVSVSFFGSDNKKREVEMIWTMDDASYYGAEGVVADVGTMIELYRDEASLKGDLPAVYAPPAQSVVVQGLSLANIAGIAIGGVVVGVVLVMAVVFSIYRKMQNQLTAAQQAVQQQSQPLLA